MVLRILHPQVLLMTRIFQIIIWRRITIDNITNLSFEVKDVREINKDDKVLCLIPNQEMFIEQSKTPINHNEIREYFRTTQDVEFISKILSEELYAANVIKVILDFLEKYYDNVFLEEDKKRMNKIVTKAWYGFDY